MKRALLVAGLVLLLAVLAAGGYAQLVWTSAPPGPDVYADLDARVTFDARGIPTIEAEDWPKLYEAQGFVLASQRFFHMDLLRRASAGRLAEVFGPKMVEWDTLRRVEGWGRAADDSYARLPADQRAVLEAYARGVNRFLEQHPEHAGIEYRLLGLEPEPWQPQDSLRVLLIMAFQLSKGSDEELERSIWQAHLPPAWFAFLFPSDHPWNEPLFGDAPRDRPALPAAPLPAADVELGARADPGAGPLALGPADEAQGGAGASNSWAWCGRGKCFLANDPHLGATVPHVWYATRLRVHAKDWVVGVAIPGIPGITIGMNPYLAWSFTNTGEDVDDYLEEKVSDDGARYLARVEAGEPVWADVEAVAYTIEVKGGAPVQGVARFTHRGPLARRPPLAADRWFSRQWLPLRPGMLRLPLALNRAKSWAEANAALDEMRVPAQNVVIVDREGRIGYRTSGTGVARGDLTGRVPQPALQGEWAGYQPYASRPRLEIGPIDGAASATTTRSLVTANERLWVDAVGQRWADDLRADRLKALLRGLDDATEADMNRLQRDTTSRFHRLIVRWVADRAAPEGAAQREMVARWQAWSGEAEGHPRTTAEALYLESRLQSVAVDRVRQAFLPEALQASLPYRARLDSGWMIRALTTAPGFGVFGFDERALATALLADVAAQGLPPHPEANRWRAQHPFVGRAPVVGDEMRVPEPTQAGHWDVPRVETPKYGASVRLVWDLARPAASTWALPVGQSGHPASPHYSDLMTAFRAGERWRVFAPHEADGWWFAPRGPALGGPGARAADEAR